MYTPPYSRLDDASGWDLIRAHPFAALVAGGDALEAAHLPLLPDGPDALIGHVARGNSLWRMLRDGAPALAIFAGPHHYISPRWYATASDRVPTWNYTAVHAHCRAELIEDDAAVAAYLDRLVAHFEAEVDATGASSAANPPLSAPDAAYLAGLRRGIVAFRLHVLRLEAKAKLGQNRSAADRRGAVAGLRGLGTAEAAAVAALMARSLGDEPLD